jgi:hypothetical protein
VCGQLSEDSPRTVLEAELVAKDRFSGVLGSTRFFSRDIEPFGYFFAALHF